ncbi:MAG: CidA/LrgA family protein [Agathobaculum sp.]|uniref:CidA/LrgA family protein n=1 Tax=Agathobaculum sp. TaxID=2048138 RepID=UPI0025BAE89A|nr:CidA/LrgA family protein [Agathobaculum sp.]MCI7124729.1 CidA/LrgA family protein [Agathobaculum sp.]MDY3711733.1 CidA/LrgA family protein [Agathobaculum sp.]
MSYLEQLGVLLGCCVAGDALSLLLRGRLPGNILGLTLLLVLLICGMVKPAHVADTADFLLRNMAILFLPACLGVLDIFADIKTEILGIIAVCALTTLCTAAATALTVHLVCRLQRRAGKEGGA